MNTELIKTVAVAVGLLIKGLAEAAGEPVADVRKRVVAEIERTAADPSDETDVVAADIDGALPNSER